MALNVGRTDTEGQGSPGGYRLLHPGADVSLGFDKVPPRGWIGIWFLSSVRSRGRNVTWSFIEMSFRSFAYTESG